MTLSGWSAPLLIPALSALTLAGACGWRVAGWAFEAVRRFRGRGM